jgi:hypothetical protein
VDVITSSDDASRADDGLGSGSQYSHSPWSLQRRALSWPSLGHRNVADTCWYLHATPLLMRGVADACERFLDGEAR